MKILRTLSVFALAVSLSGCITDMDPFEGGDGVRVNINGEKCVMYGMPGSYYATLDAANDVSTFRAEITMMTTVTDARINYLLPEKISFDRIVFDLSFNIQENNSFVREQKYEILAFGTKTATMSLPEVDTNTGSPNQTVKLKGWIYFLSLGNVIEARFDLDGKGPDGKEYTLRHGFLRLHEREERQ